MEAIAQKLFDRLLILLNDKVRYDKWTADMATFFSLVHVKENKN